jgi:hypothetical protein
MEAVGFDPRTSPPYKYLTKAALLMRHIIFYVIIPIILIILYGFMRIKEERGQCLALWAKRLAIWSPYNLAKGARAQY